MRLLVAGAMIAASLVLQGCATAEPMMAPDGKQGYFVKCGAAALNKCFAKAAEVCPAGYDTVDRTSGNGGMVMPVGTGAMFVPGPHTMFIECH